MGTIEQDIKGGKLKPVYLLYGNEPYLIRHNEKVLREHVASGDSSLMNVTILSDKEFSYEKAVDAIEQMPFFAEYRLVIIKGCGLFAAGKKGDSEKMVELLKDVPETSIVLFVEEKVDKRSALFKAVTKHGTASELNTPSEKELISWAKRHFKTYGVEISDSNIVLLLRTVATDMGTIASEISKLCTYLGKGSTVSAQDIKNVCTRSLESSIFELVDAVGRKQAGAALDTFSNLLLMKESPIMVITMIARQFRLVLSCLLLKERGLTAAEITQELSQRSFIVNECLRQAGNFTKEALMNGIESCLQADLKIKTGRLNDKLAVEMLIVGACGGE